MKNFKIYCVSKEDNSKYEISLNELVTNGNYTEDEVCKLLDYIETTKYKTFRWNSTLFSGFKIMCYNKRRF